MGSKMRFVWDRLVGLRSEKARFEGRESEKVGDGRRIIFAVWWAAIDCWDGCGGGSDVDVGVKCFG